MKKKICQVKGCSNIAKYALYYTDPRTGTKKWLHVCKECEGEIGNENEKRAGIEDKHLPKMRKSYINMAFV